MPTEPDPEELTEAEEIDAELEAVAVTEEGETAADLLPDDLTPTQQPVPGEAPVDDGGWGDQRPVTKPRFDRLMQQRDAFKGHWDRARAATEAQKQQHDALVSEVAKMRQTLQEQQPEPELTEDQRFAREVADQVRGPVEEKVAGIESRLDAEEQQKRETAQVAAVHEYVDSDRDAFEAEHPDLKNAIQHAAAQRFDEWMAITHPETGLPLTEPEALGAVRSEINSYIQAAIQRGISPAEFLYNTAVRNYGWQPPVAAGGNGQPAAEPAAGDPARPSRREQLARGSRTLGSVSGKSPHVDVGLTKQMLQEADDAEYAALVGKYGWEKVEAVEKSFGEVLDF